jgi:hypothetical protein
VRSRGICWWRGVLSTILAATGIGSMMQWGLDGRCLMLDTCSVVVLFGAIVASIVSLARLIASIYNLDVGLVFFFNKECFISQKI